MNTADKKAISEITELIGDFSNVFISHTYLKLSTHHQTDKDHFKL